MARDPQSYLPLTEASFQVMAALADGGTHGYQILKDVDTRTDGRVRLSTGTLYGLIKRLLAEGLIAEIRRRPGAGDADRGRRDYQLTDFGRQVAEAEAARLQQLVATARAARLIPKRG